MEEVDPLLEFTVEAYWVMTDRRHRTVYPSYKPTRYGSCRACSHWGEASALLLEHMLEGRIAQHSKGGLKMEAVVSFLGSLGESR
jgi:hypothetical protein